MLASQTRNPAEMEQHHGAYRHLFLMPFLKEEEEKKYVFFLLAVWVTSALLTEGENFMHLDIPSALLICF